MNSCMAASLYVTLRPRASQISGLVDRFSVHDTFSLLEKMIGVYTRVTMIRYQLLLPKNIGRDRNGELVSVAGEEFEIAFAVESAIPDKREPGNFHLLHH